MACRRIRVEAHVLIIAGRWIAAMVATPIIAGVVTFGVMWFLWRNWEDGVPAARSIGGGVAIVSVVLTQIAVGLLLIIAVWRPLTFRTVVGVGAILGNVPFAFVVWVSALAELLRGNVSTEISRHWYGWPGAIRDIALGTVTGAIASAVFWMIGIWKTGLEHRLLRDSARP
jgi:hypothetical protein